MLKKTFIAVAIPLLALLIVAARPPEAGRGPIGSPPQRAGSAMATAPEITGTFQKMIVENGSVTMAVDLNGLNGSGSLVARRATLQFLKGPNSFFPFLG